jgi:hypothetical protein
MALTLLGVGLWLSMSVIGLAVGGNRGLGVIGIVWNVSVFDGQALLLQEGECVQALVRVAVWSRPGQDELAWSGHFLHPAPAKVLKLGNAKLQLPGLTETAIQIDYRICSSDNDLGGDFSGIGQPPTTARISE